MCRAESPRPGSVSAGIVATFESKVSSAFTWAADSIGAQYDSVTATLEVKYDGLQRGLRDDFTGALCIYQACSQAESYAGDAILEETGYQFKALLSGLIPGLLQMVAIVGASTILGAGIGALIGALAGGVGAAPGAVVGADLGFDVGMAALTWLGVAFLAASIAKGFAELLEAIRNGVEWAWAARKLNGTAQKEQLDKASHELARSAGIVMRLVLQGILAYLLKKAAMGATRGAVATARGVQMQGAAAVSEATVAELVGKLRASRFGDGFADWVEKNWRDLQKNPKLQPKEGAIAGQGEGGGSAGQDSNAGKQSSGSSSADEDTSDSSSSSAQAAPKPTRLPQDVAVNPNPPPALPLNRPVGLSATQNAQVQADIAAARAEGATDFRVNQQQVNAAGERVGVNRPDLQYTDANGQRVYVEYDTPESGRGPAHETRLNANDPDGDVILKIVP